MQHDESEYGEIVDEQGKHSGGPFTIHVSPKMRITDVRKVIKVCVADFFARSGPDLSG